MIGGLADRSPWLALGMGRSYGDPPHYYETTVEGESWVVRGRAKAGTYYFAWVSGPNKGYGFTSASSDGSALSQAQMDEAIREFMDEIGPDTGHLTDA